MYRSNLAIDTSNYENHIEALVKFKRQDIRNSPAYKISRYKTKRSESGESQWTISFTHNDSLANEACCQPYVPESHGTFPILEESVEQSTSQDDLDLSLQRYIEKIKLDILEALKLDFSEDTWDIETRLIPPPRPRYRIKVKFHFRGKAAPRIFFDPDRD